MKLALTADWQFAPHLRLSKPTPEGLPSRFVDQIACFRWVVDSARMHKCDRLVIAGDLFDNRTAIDIPVLDQVSEVIDAASKWLPVDILPGNHDSYARSPKYTSVRALRSANVHVYLTPTILTGTRVVYLPWHDDPAEMRAMVDRVQPKRHKDAVLISHALLEGAVTAKGKGVPLDALRPDRFRRVWLGDVHEPLEVSKTVQYIGSPMQIDYRDAGGERGFFVFDTETGQYDYVHNDVSPRFHIVTGATSVEDLNILPHDFVRVKTVDAKQAKACVESVRRTTGEYTHVECATVETDDEPPRMAVKSGDDDAAILQRYVALQSNLPGDADALVKLGAEILSEVS